MFPSAWAFAVVLVGSAAAIGDFRDHIVILGSGHTVTRIALIVAGLVLIASAGRAQLWDTSIFTGNTPSATSSAVSPEFTQLDIRGATTWGVESSRALTRHWAADVVWTQQKTALADGTIDAGAFDLFSMTVRQAHGNVICRFDP